MHYTPSPMELMFWHTLALIVTACLFTPVFKRLGLGSILGYLVAGLSVNLVFSGNFSEHPEELLHFSEFGVVLFLFVIGLELNPQTLWRMRADIFGLGTAQMLGCGIVLAGAALIFNFPFNTALAIGLGLALSSTAIVMSQLDERRQRNTPHGRKSFGILLLQDFAIVPLLLLVNALAPAEGDFSLQTMLVDIGAALLAIIGLIVVGRYGLDRMFALLARTGMPEIMTAAALGVVIAAALLMDMVGMSYAMGSFLAGVMLAESKFRHEIEANIEPFRGLFLGLFFMAVGLTLNLQVIVEYWYIILAAAPVTMLLKAVVIFAVTRAFYTDHNTSVKVALSLPQHGEFGFVLFASAAAIGLLAADISSILISIIAVSMALSALTSRLEPLLLSRKAAVSSIEEDYSDANGRLLIIGFGRFGQIVSQPLFASGIDVTILDHNVDRINEANTFGFRVHYGDGRRRDILRTAGINKIDAVAVCTDNPETTNHIVAEIKQENPTIKVYVRSRDRHHSIRLFELGPEYSVRETFESALLLSKHLLIGLGTGEPQAQDLISDIRAKDLLRLKAQVSEGFHAGNEHLHVTAVKPEPL